MFPLELPCSSPACLVYHLLAGVPLVEAFSIFRIGTHVVELQEDSERLTTGETRESTVLKLQRVPVLQAPGGGGRGGVPAAPVRHEMGAPAGG